MEEIEDGRDEAEEEDSVDATSVRPGGSGEGAGACGRGGIPAGLDWCGRGPAVQEGFPSVYPQLRGHRPPRHQLRKIACRLG